MNRIIYTSCNLLVLLLLLGIQAHSQVSITPGALVYLQNFDTYNGTSITSVPQWNIGGSFTYRGTGTGTSNSGGAWAYGIGADRSLGFLGSNTSSSIEYSISFVNNTGAAITQLRLSYDFEQWRYESGNTNGWTVTGTGALAAIPLSGLNTNSGNSGTNGVVQTTPKLLLLNNLNIAPGATFGIKWSCSNGTGNDNGVAIDNFRLEVPCTPQLINIDTTLCAGTAFVLHNQSYTVSQTVNDSLHSAAGCDSVRSYHLTFLPAVTGVLYDSVCAGATYNWAGQGYTASGTYSHVFPAFTGCDSTVTLHLYVRPSITPTFADTICNAGVYSWAGQTFTATGSYNHTFLSATGCDSITTLNLYVRPGISHTFADTMCAGDVYSWAGQAISAGGQYTHTFTAATGCDSVVTFNLHARPELSFSFNDTVCNAVAYNWAGQNIATSGTYTHVFASYTGCDSTVTLHLYVRPAIAYAFADTACAATTYNWAGSGFTATGIYSHTFISYTGCDSMVTLNLYVRPAITYTFSDTICNAASYNWAGQNFVASGSYSHTFISYTGCDSLVTLQLYMRPAISYAFADTICAAAGYNWGGQSYGTSGNYSHTFTAFSGCDSTVILSLYIRPAVSATDSQSICYNMTYNFGGQALSTSGTYMHTFQDSHGCDSLVTLLLHVNTAITNTVNRSICYNTSLNWGAQTLTATGTYTQTFTAASSCDSIVTMNLTVMPLHTDTASHAVCFGAGYTWGAQVLNASGTYTQVFPAANGCDSLAVLHFTVLPLKQDTLAASICNGAAYSFGGQSYGVSGYYPATFTAANGCDSIVVLHLAVSPAATQQVIDTAACGVVLFEGNSYTASATLTDTLYSLAGCDSVYRTIHISTHPDNPLVVTIDTAGCGSVTWLGTAYTESTNLYDTMRSVYGCDSAVHIVRIHVHQSETRTITHEMCEGAEYRFNGNTYTHSGTYPLAFKNQAGCDSVIVLEITVHALPALELSGYDETRNYCVGDSLRLAASGAQTYSWIYVGADTFRGPFLETIIHNYNNEVQLSATDEYGCSNQRSLDLEAHPCCNIWMPNAFSPNGDGNNDDFKPVTTGHPNDYVMRIFNRWGQNVFITYDVQQGWDGQIKGKPADIADYYYRVSGKCVNGEIIDLKGSCTLIR